MSGISCIDDIKNIWVYDLEVFIKDWTACFLSVDTGEIKTFHNDKSGLCEFINSTKPILCGYNNGGYDNYVLLTMLTDGTTESTKEINDYIIGGNQGWSYPKNKGKYIGNYITGSIDLMQDTPMGLSLKACEANLGLSIVESTVDFTIDRKLTATEVEEVLYYNTHDVKCTYELLKVRKNYLNGKITVANLCGLDPVKALGMTNAKLTASFLNATKLDNAEKDEFIIPIVDSVPIKKYTEVLDFFKSFEIGRAHV